jgi:hypothetical protein
LFASDKAQVYLTCEVTDYGGLLTNKECQDIFNPPKPDASKEELEANLSNIRAISKALNGKIHVESHDNFAKFVFVIQI